MESDPKATPINALPKGNLTQEDDQQFIQNILNQMKGDSQESEQNYQQTQQKYNNQQFGHNPAEQHQMNQQQLQAQYEQEEDYEYEEEPVKQTFGDKLKHAIKGPLVFFVLYVLLCFPFIRVFVVNQIARFTENENFQLYGATLLLGLIGGVIFYLISTFLF
jgi:preprotein translocase subunit SecF